MYNATKWLDKVVDVDSGEVIQAGTDQSAAHFNNMESGITATTRYRLRSARRKAKV